MSGSARGWVYVLTNPAMPGMVKIGLTRKHPVERAADLTRATGVPAPFRVAWYAAVADCKAVEDAVHARLDRVRVRHGRRREFFRIGVEGAAEAIVSCSGALVGRPKRPKPGHWRRRRGGRRAAASTPFRTAFSAACGLAIAAAIFLAATRPALFGQALAAVAGMAGSGAR